MNVPIPFQDADEIEELGEAAFLHIEQPSPESTRRYGALLLINARGEPTEFAFNRVELMRDVLWRPEDQTQAAARRLAVTLFRCVSGLPSLLLCRAATVGPHLFGPAGPLQLSLPVVRVATADEAVGYTGAEARTTARTADAGGGTREIHLFWTPETPASDPAALLLARLAERGLLLEPFERAGLGLREVYGDPLGASS